jgi:hypothetical protein
VYITSGNDEEVESEELILQGNEQRRKGKPAGADVYLPSTADEDEWTK